MARPKKVLPSEILNDDTAKEEVMESIVPEFKFMIFREDKHVDGKLFFEKGKVYQVPMASVNRWQVRGGVVLTEEELAKYEREQVRSPINK